MLNTLLSLAREAGQAIMEIYSSEFSVEHKADRSPVTAADQIAEKIILAGLRKLTPEIPVIAEEQVSAHGLPEIVPGRFWLVDPLDGTKEFLKRNGEFTVNIALIKDRKPLLGMIHIPVEESYYWNDADGAYCGHANHKQQRIHARAIPASGAILISSRSHGGEDFQRILGDMVLGGTETAGSSLKFCRLAEGKADLYPRLKPTMEWDIAAGHAILSAAGGSVTLLDGSPMTYGKKDFRNPFFIARGLQ